ncbi:hypothetical protein [Nocardia terpenica]|uniref:Uncharacterized protein n=1 Tax=Nocardia terpenica TaxID=455432 RepID=A0A6G9Z7S4_9NOCA|nr:hypothetical protein [Nocardia terpenica]QIS21407.1 hypothetical protein F6W96_26785 [Nocardia terpenica]
MISPQRAASNDTADTLSTIGTLIEADNLRDAKHQLRQLQSGINDDTWLIITEITHTLRFKPYPAAIDKLRKLWQHNEPYRDIIEACVPKPGERQYRPPTITPTPRPSPHDTRPLPATVGEAYEDALAKGERNDPGTERPELIVDRHDYDEDAAAPIRESLCVSCRLECAATDRWHQRARIGHCGDGLCPECRSLGRPGVPTLPTGHTYTQAVHARLEFLAESFNTRSRGIFRQEWRYADDHTRTIIERWVAEHTLAEPVAPPAHIKLVELNGTCEKCGDWRQLRDALCVECHPGLGGQTTTPAGALVHGTDSEPIPVSAEKLADNAAAAEPITGTASVAERSVAQGRSPVGQQSGQAGRKSAIAPAETSRSPASVTARETRSVAASTADPGPRPLPAERRRTQQRQPPRPRRASRSR